MKRIAIIEPGDVNHYVAVNSIYKIFKEGNDITIFTNQYVKKNLEEVLDSDTKYVIKKDNEGFYSFLKNIEKYAFDIIFITSLHDPHLLFFCLFNPKTRVYLTIHNANLWFGGFRFGIPESIFYFLRKSWLKKVSGINVDSDDMRGHILKKWGYPKKINVIPFNVYEGMVDNSKKDKKLHMCIPGNLSTVRRDYLSVFKVIQQLPGDYKNKLTLELLGRPCEEGSAEIIEKGKELKSGGWDIIFHEEYIPPNEFDYALSKTDIILGPVKIEYRLYENIHEVDRKSVV